MPHFSFKPESVSLSASRSLRILLCTVAIVAGAHGASASAQDADDAIDPTRLYGGLWLGFGGDADFDGDGEFGGDLETTVGGQFGLDVVAARYLSLGAEARIGAAKWKVSDRTKLIDLVFKPRLRLPLTGLPLELYATVPIGLTIPRLADFGPQDADGKLGWNLGAGAGVSLFLTDNFGLNAEPMWLMHRFKAEEGGDFVLNQFSLFLNAVLAL